MNDKTLHTKNEILQWILELEDESIIDKLLNFKKECETNSSVSEPDTEYVVNMILRKDGNRGFLVKNLKKEYINI